MAYKADGPVGVSIIFQSKIELGKCLYFDPRLSKTGKILCNSCHTIPGSGTDNKSVSTGINGLQGVRRAPTVWNAAFLNVQFWDGRATSLEEQAKGPLTNPLEMGMENHGAVVKQLQHIKRYKKYFEKAFGKDDQVLNIE